MKTALFATMLALGTAGIAQAQMTMTPEARAAMRAEQARYDAMPDTATALA